jgi:hypothetical protein
VTARWRINHLAVLLVMPDGVSIGVDRYRCLRTGPPPSNSQRTIRVGSSTPPRPPTRAASAGTDRSVTTTRRLRCSASTSPVGAPLSAHRSPASPSGGQSTSYRTSARQRTMLEERLPRRRLPRAGVQQLRADELFVAAKPVDRLFGFGHAATGGRALGDLNREIPQTNSHDGTHCR